jgi:hypothetical protein
MIFLHRVTQIARHLSVHVFPNISLHQEMNFSEQETIKDLMHFLVFEIIVHDALRCVWNSRKGGCNPPGSVVPRMRKESCSRPLTSVNGMEESCASEKPSSFPLS